MTQQRRPVAYAAALVLSLGIVSTGVGLIVRRHRLAHPQTVSAVPYTVMFNETSFRSPSDQHGFLRATRTRYVRGDGSFKEVATNYKADGSVAGVRTLFGITGRGVFGVDNENHKLVFISQKGHAAHAINEEQLRADLFSRDDVVLGYKVRTLSTISSDNSYDELYRAPSLAGAMLKDVWVGANGNSIVLEAVKVELGEPSASEFSSLPDYPVDYGPYERRIDNTEAEGNHDLADQMRQVLAEAKTKF